MRLLAVEALAPGPQELDAGLSALRLGLSWLAADVEPAWSSIPEHIHEWWSFERDNIADVVPRLGLASCEAIAEWYSRAGVAVPNSETLEAIADGFVHSVVEASIHRAAKWLSDHAPAHDDLVALVRMHWRSIDPHLASDLVRAAADTGTNAARNMFAELEAMDVPPPVRRALESGVAPPFADRQRRT